MERAANWTSYFLSEWILPKQGRRAQQALHLYLAVEDGDLSLREMVVTFSESAEQTTTAARTLWRQVSPSFQPPAPTLQLVKIKLQLPRPFLFIWIIHSC